MDYMDILKRAFNTIWRYKILWLFGLFAGSSGGSFNYGGSFNFNLGSGEVRAPSSEQIQSLIPLFIAIGVLAVLIGIVFFVLSFAAQGGLIHLVNEAEEERPVRGGEGWRVGFHRWWRIWWIELIVALPIIAALALFLVIFGASLAGVIGGAVGLNKSGTGGAVAALGAGIAGLCFGALILIVFSIAYSIIFGTAAQLALRYGVLEDRKGWAAVKQAWSDVWAKRGAVVMFFVVFLAQMVFSIALGIVLAVIVLPAGLIALSGAWPAAVLLGLVAVVVAAIPGAAFASFVSASWTIFFRRMTGIARPVPVSAPSPAYPAPAPVYPPPPAGYPPPPPSGPPPQQPPPPGAPSGGV